MPIGKFSVPLQYITINHNNMKKSSFLSAALLCGMTLGFTSCSDSDSPNIESTNSLVLNENKVWTKCDRPTYISGLDGENENLRKVINARFTNQVNSIDMAEVAFIGGEDNTVADKVEKLIARGGICVVVRPKFNQAESDYYMDQDDNPDVSELLYAYADGFYYTMFDEDPFNGDYQFDESKAMSDEELQAVMNEKTTQEKKPVNVYDFDNSYEQNENYYNTRLTSFIDWVKTTFDQVAQQNGSTRGDNSDYSYESLKKNLDFEGETFQFDIPVSLNAAICKYTPSGTWDYLNKSSSISVKYNIYPVFAGKVNEDKAGEYYLVTGSVVPHNDAMWGPYQSNHALSAVRIFGYWFNFMDLSFDLVDEKEDKIVDGLQFHTRPIPENKNSSTQYSNGFSWGMTFTAGGGYKWGANKGADFHGSASFNFQFTSSQSYALETIEFNSITAGSTVKYNYHSNNVKLHDNGGTERGEYEDNFPAACRSEFTARNAWIWFIPYGKSGAEANSTVRRRIRMNIKISYSSWNHWRAAWNYDGNRVDYDYGLKQTTFYQTLKVPNRTLWGLIALKNASNTTVANIRYYNEKGEKVDSFKSSWNVNEVATRALPEGTYKVTYETRNANQGNKLTGIYKLENVQVKQGKTKQASTTEISTINAVKE